MIITWQQIALVAFGGGLGSVARFLLSAYASGGTPGWRFPVGTFLVNLAGCLVIGALWAAAERWPVVLTPHLRLLLFTGVLGGFTTFSSFGLETVLLLRRGETGVAGLYVALSLVCGLGFLWLAIRAVR
ncbi:MAG: fluoride efflux transporter CrcB [Opitutaceae bacterium]|jgi:CrcB protein|nr:fluoride efflux transporter CrcB [Opitutaceae bacterium]